MSNLFHDIINRDNIPNGIERIRSKTSTNGNTPTEQEGSEERALKSADENNGFYK